MTETTMKTTSDQTDFGNYVSLLKPRVMSLVVFTAAVGLVVAPGSMNLVLAFASVLFIALGAGASGSLNMWWDADIDRIMKRTQDRPVPSGKVSANNAMLVGLWMSVISIGMLGLASNWLAAALLAFTIFFLRSYLFNVAQTLYSTKYCYWWCCWSFPSNGWLGSCIWFNIN